MTNLFDRYKPDPGSVSPPKQAKGTRKCRVCLYWYPLDELDKGWCKSCLTAERQEPIGEDD